MFETFKELKDFLKHWFKEASFYKLEHHEDFKYLIYIYYPNGSFYLQSISPLKFLTKKSIRIKNEDILSDKRLP